jgi:hypothetical protein
VYPLYVPRNWKRKTNKPKDENKVRCLPYLEL